MLATKLPTFLLTIPKAYVTLHRSFMKPFDSMKIFFGFFNPILGMKTRLQPHGAIQKWRVQYSMSLFFMVYMFDISVGAALAQGPRESPVQMSMKACSLSPPASSSSPLFFFFLSAVSSSRAAAGVVGGLGKQMARPRMTARQKEAGERRNTYRTEVGKPCADC